ncbi:UvrD-helicase domain-containing protein [Rubricoccus marinus]|uniref:DNA 3'-5' helicase n=1 Tax=Rubricoccus marinus TaxID=716817 RepID=A0A259TVM3_9BACT|nr:UvrD-helicase domain-containing protein [Rubricoccus marinus]OZC01815.1 hypothetical protein BSZ36_01715 [Rubricoccus marinus]
MTETFKALDVPLAPGITLVEASAGTGKTYALTELVLRLVLEDGALGEGTPDLRKLLVVTFTVAATEELKTRIRRALREALDAFEGGEASGVVEPFLARYGATPEAREAGAQRLRHALGQVGEAAVFTIHGFCKRVLERSAFESGEPFAFDFTEDAARLQTRVARDVWHGLVGGHTDLGPLALAAGWTLDRLTQHAANATQFVDTRILPPAEPLADAMAEVRDARQRLRDAWHPAAQEDIVDPRLWRMDTKSKPFTTDLRGVFARVDAFARGDWGEIGAVEMATVERASAAIKNGSKAGKEAVSDVEADAGFRACTDVVAAISRLETALIHAFVASLEAGTRRAKAAASLLTFDDLIERLDRALAHPATGPSLRRAIQDQFAVALIDEFQDTDPTQYRIFRRAFGASPEASGESATVHSPLPTGPATGRPLFFIGDPKQAIYAFRGADVFAYLEARGDADRRFTLGTNYRSSPDLVSAVNALFSRLGTGGKPFIYDGIPFEPVAANASEPGIRGVTPVAPFVWWAGDGLERGRGNIVTKGNAREAAMEATVAEICRLLNDERAEIRDAKTGLWRRLEAGDLAVLTRTNGQARELQDRLRRANVVAVVGKGDDIRTSREMDEIERVLRAMARPTDSRRVRAALATEMWGWTGADLAAASGDSDEQGRMLKVVEGLRKDRALWRRNGVFGALTAWVRREDVRQRLHQYADRERRLTNLRHCLELLHEAETSEDRSVDELLHWVRTRTERTFAERQRVEMRLESDDHAVQLVTMHNAKGLEYPVVFAPFVWDDKEKATWHGTFEASPPVAHVGSGGAVYDLGSPAQEAHRALADAERLAESLRLTYVALTRARERLYVVWGPLSGGHASGIGHLLRTLPLPLAEGLASFDDATRKTALEHLRTSLATLEEWIARAELGHVMAVAPLPQGGGRVEREAQAEDASGVRTLGAGARDRVHSPEARASFSSWASGAPRDDRADEGDAAPEADGDTPEAGLFAFASGPRAGTCLHEVLENAVFRLPDSYRDLESSNAQAIARVLRRHGLHDGTSRVHRAVCQPLADVSEMIATLAETEMPGLGFALKDVPRGGFAAEWRFVAPLARVAPSQIADLFREHGDEVLQSYAEVVARLAPEAVDGLFVGSADLVVQHPGEERWSLIDWKSNHLGPTAAHYGAEPLARTMRAHHYLLQAHLYLAGLHRYLRTRLADYDYDRHVGGAAYVFLRGVAPPTSAPEASGENLEAATGFHVVRPPRALVEALDALLFAPLAEEAPGAGDGARESEPRAPEAG